MDTSIVTTKVKAIAGLIKLNGGKATWKEIYDRIERFCPDAKASREWQAGIRGVVYREIRNGKTFRKLGHGTIGLASPLEKSSLLTPRIGKSRLSPRLVLLVRPGQERLAMSGKTAVDDLLTGRSFLIERASCGLRCRCDAIATLIVPPPNYGL